MKTKSGLIESIIAGLIVPTILLAKIDAAPLEHEFVGVKKCAMCHKKPDQGEQSVIWEKSKHARAYETLGTPAAKEVATKLGIADPQTSGKCLKCHSTAYYFTEAKVTEVIAVEEAISCESCHAPGKDYMKKNVMEDKAKAISLGLIIPDEQICRKCHNPESPAFKSFDYQENFEKIKHPVPKK